MIEPVAWDDELELELDLPLDAPSLAADHPSVRAFYEANPAAEAGSDANNAPTMIPAAEAGAPQPPAAGGSEGALIPSTSTGSLCSGRCGLPAVSM